MYLFQIDLDLGSTIYNLELGDLMQKQKDLYLMWLWINLQFCEKWMELTSLLFFR